MKTDIKRELLISFSVIAGALVIAAAALYFFSGDLSAQADAVIRDRGIIQKQTDALGSLAGLKRDAPEAARYEKAISTLLPGQYQLVNFEQWLGDYAAKHSVTAKFAFQGGTSPAQPGVAGTAGFSMDVEGPTDAVLSFLEDLETKAPAYLLSVSSFDATNDSGRTRLAILGALYFK